jgi:hypothetical protein
MVYGSNTLLSNDLFRESTDDLRAANHIDEAMNVLTGISANRSITTGQVVQVKDILEIPQ